MICAPPARRYHRRRRQRRRQQRSVVLGIQMEILLMGGGSRVQVLRRSYAECWLL